MAVGFRYDVDWGDGTVPDVIEATPGNDAGVLVHHVYVAENGYTVRVTATDQNGAVSETATLAISVTRIALLDDPLHPGQFMLIVGGTPLGDDIRVRVGRTRGEVVVRVNNVIEGAFRPTSRLIIHGYDGNDHINIVGGVTLPAWLYGDAGNDDLVAGGGPTIILGGEGDDDLFGRNARDLLFGGLGADLLRGGRGDDLLVAGTTAFDNDESTLAAIQTEWLAVNNYARRLANLRTSFLVTDGPSRTLFDDEDADTLIGENGRDAYFVNLDAGVFDTIRRRERNEQRIDVD